RAIPGEILALSTSVAPVTSPITAQILRRHRNYWPPNPLFGPYFTIPRLRANFSPATNIRPEEGTYLAGRLSRRHDSQDRNHLCPTVSRPSMYIRHKANRSRFIRR